MEEGEKTCPFCAETVKAAAIVCKHCGRDIEGKVAQPAAAVVAPGQPPEARLRKLLIWGVLLIVATALALGWSSHSRKMQRIQAEAQARRDSATRARELDARVRAARDEALRRQDDPEERRRQWEADAERQRAAQRLDRDTNLQLLRPIDAVATKWIDAARVAMAAPRIGLGSHVATLQTIRREAESTSVPPCMTDGKTALLASMSNTIDALLLFMASQSDGQKAKVDDRFELASAGADRYAQVRKACVT